MGKTRQRGEAWKGYGYGTQRYFLYCEAKKHIINSINSGFYLEAITVIESIISDRLESRVSFLKGENFGFKTLGKLIQETSKLENDTDISALLQRTDSWRQRRNKALHEMVKIEENTKKSMWEERTQKNRKIALEGFDILIRLYQRIAELNPNHPDHVFLQSDMMKIHPDSRFHGKDTATLQP